MRNNMMLRATIRASCSQRPISIHEIWNSILFKCCHQYIVRYERRAERYHNATYIMAGNLWMPHAMLCKNERERGREPSCEYAAPTISSPKNKRKNNNHSINSKRNLRYAYVYFINMFFFEISSEFLCQEKQPAPRRLHRILFTFAFVSFFLWIIGWCGGCALCVSVVEFQYRKMFFVEQTDQKNGNKRRLRCATHFGKHKSRPISSNLSVFMLLFLFRRNMKFVSQSCGEKKVNMFR